MNNLREYRFDELYQMDSGISTSKAQAGHGAPFVSFKDIYNNPILPEILTEKMDTSKEEQKKYSVKKGDIFLTRTSEVLDELAMSSVAVKDYPRATFSGFAKRLRPLQNNITYDKFMAFYLRSSYFRKVINAKAVMTLRASFNEEIFSYINLLLPDYDTQVKIGNLFYNIECKIRNNNKVNVELESMAKTIYDYWFLQFDFPDENGRPYRASGGKMVWNEKINQEIPEGWRVGNLYDIADFINGLACQKFRPISDDKKLPVVKIAEMHDGITSSTEFVRADIPKKNIISDGDILFSWSATLVTTIWSGGKAGLNQHIFKVVPKNYTKYYVYMQLSAYIINFVKIAEARKTTMGHITTDHIKQSKIILPPKSIVLKYSDIVNDVFSKIIFNNKENREMKSIRDFLFPLLMNGQVGFK